MYPAMIPFHETVSSCASPSGITVVLGGNYIIGIPSASHVHMCNGVK